MTHEMTVISFGEGRHYPAGGASRRAQRLRVKLGRIERKQGDTVTEVMRSNAIITINPGERVGTVNPAAAAGQPLQRPIEDVVYDVKNGYVSPEAAEKEYGVRVDTHSWTGAPTALRA